MMKGLGLLVLLALTLVLAACGGAGEGPGGTGTLSGLLTAPAGGDAAGTTVTACASADPQCLSGVSAQAEAGGSFTISGLADGSYTLKAQKDVNGNGQLDAGDYTGSYNAAVSPPAENISIELELVGGGGGGGTAGTISGTAVAPAGGDVTGSIAAACPVTGGNYDCTGVSAVQVGAGGAFTITNLPTGSYVIIAAKDINGNGTAGDDGDYRGFYTGGGTDPVAVTPPASNLTIQMVLVGGGGGGGGTSGTISGTITAPAGIDPSGTIVGACATTDPNCNNLVAAFAGAGGGYVLENVPAGSYEVLAVKDANGNGQFDPGIDYVGVYPTTVSPPATGINIQLMLSSPQQAALLGAEVLLKEGGLMR